MGSSESEASEIAVLLSESISVSSATSTPDLGTVRRCGALLAACCLLERPCGGVNTGAVFLAEAIVRKKSLLITLVHLRRPTSTLRAVFLYLAISRPEVFRDMCSLYYFSANLEVEKSDGRLEIEKGGTV